MAINPVSNASSFSVPIPLSAQSPQNSEAGTTAAADANSAVTAQIQQELASLAAASNDDPLLEAPATTSDGTSLLDSFSSMLGSNSSGSTGDPLLDDLNALDSSAADSTGGSPTNEDALLSQQLTSFLLQQAAGSYSNGQSLGNSQLPGSGVTDGTAG
jgi:hypothetical protein